LSLKQWSSVPLADLDACVPSCSMPSCSLTTLPWNWFSRCILLHH
jgi:hypothetical protein